jgi:hypothetical protein
MRWGRNHDRNDTISCEVAKRLVDCVPFEESRVEIVRAVYKFSKIFQGNVGKERDGTLSC